MSDNSLIPKVPARNGGNNGQIATGGLTEIKLTEIKQSSSDESTGAGRERDKERDSFLSLATAHKN